MGEGKAFQRPSGTTFRAYGGFLPVNADMVDVMLQGFATDDLGTVSLTIGQIFQSVATYDESRTYSPRGSTSPSWSAAPRNSTDGPPRAGQSSMIVHPSRSSSEQVFIEVVIRILSSAVDAAGEMPTSSNSHGPTASTRPSSSSGW